MIIGGYTNQCITKRRKFVNLDEVSFVCSPEELSRLAQFFTKVKDDLIGYNFPYGECTIQFRDKDCEWKKGDPDVIIITSPDQNG